MRHRLLKSLRIAVTAVSLLVCGLLIGLWVRSYSGTDHVAVRTIGSRPLSFWSWQGFVELNRSPYKMDESFLYERSEVLEPVFIPRWKFGSDKWYRFVLSVPHGFLVIIAAAIAALPWIKWRFSLRTLLIVLTLFAVFFGAIAMSL